jgi:hypothetical protein
MAVGVVRPHPLATPAYPKLTRPRHICRFSYLHRRTCAEHLQKLQLRRNLDTLKRGRGIANHVQHNSWPEGCKSKSRGYDGGVDADLPAEKPDGRSFVTTISAVRRGPLCCTSTKRRLKIHILKYGFRSEDFFVICRAFVIPERSEKELSLPACPRQSCQDVKLKSTCAPLRRTQTSFPPLHRQQSPLPATLTFQVSRICIWQSLNLSIELSQTRFNQQTLL